jgi:hypothetical protein
VVRVLNHGSGKRIEHLPSCHIPFRRACHDVVLFLVRASWQSSWPSLSLFTVSTMSRTLQCQKGLLDRSNEQLA